VGWYEGIDDVRLADEAAARVALAGALAAAQQAQGDAGRFIVEHGAAVLGGHSDVGMVEVHNIGADPDTSGPDASDT
jgi:hypothetical protein